MEVGRNTGGRGGGDARQWDEESYRRSILIERELSSRIVFRTAFAPSVNPNPEIVLVASSDGSLSAYSIASCIASCPRPMLCSKETDQKVAPVVLSAGPLCSIQAHKGPTYDLKLYGNDEDALLLRYVSEFEKTFLSDVYWPTDFKWSELGREPEQQMVDYN